MPVKPLGPEDIEITLPDSVIQAVNELIKEKYRGKSFTLYVRDIIARISDVNPNITKKEIMDNDYLDFGKIYGKAGWKVKYSSPDRDESFDSNFYFSR